MDEKRGSVHLICCWSLTTLNTCCMASTVQLMMFSPWK